jgi:TRAP-type C4-dicarboxylate transport system substrate-binding protein
MPTTTPSAPKPSADVKPITFKVGHDVPPMVAPVEGINWWAPAVTEATEGRVNVELYPASSLVSQQSALEAVRSGVADMYMLSISSFRKTLPICSIVGLPGVGFPDTTEEANTAHVKTFHEMLDKFPEARAEFAEFGLFYYIVYSEAYLLSADSPITVPADINGLKVGCNGVRQDLIDALGGASVTDIPPLAYEKLQTGVTEAAFSALSAIHDFKLFEVTDYMLDVPFGGGGMVFIVNMDTWQKISDYDKAIMIDMAPEAAYRTSERLARENVSAWNELKDFGMITATTADQKALWTAEFEKLWDEWMDEAVAGGMSRVDAEKLLNWWKSKSDAEWAKING